MAQQIPLQPVPAQTLTIALGGQQVAISLYAANDAGNVLGGIPLTADAYIPVDDSGTVDADSLAPSLSLSPTEWMYADVTLAGAPVVTGKLCSILQPLLETSQYTGFDGDLVFVDTQSLGLQDSTQVEYSSLGTQYQLVYYTAADIAAGLALPI